MFQIHGKPFLMLAGEVHNSSSSSLEAMETAWEKAAQLGLNAVLLPVTWELIEPEEGRLEFALVDGLIAEARKRNLKLGFLWFGAWKNAQCMYAPEWVKTDLNRFRRAEVVRGERKTQISSFHGMAYTTLSAFCEETLRADKRAFAALMRHLREVDEREHTVVYMQVENESGLLGAAREHSEEADRLFAGAVPQDLADCMKAHADTMREDVRAAVEGGAASGTWTEVFGAAAEEIFQSYYVASYIDAVAAAGKAEYDLPMAVNAWLEQGEPGHYPSGGPVGKLLELWQYAAPHIDILCPDIYVRHFCDVCDEFHRIENPLMIPETATHSHAGPRLVYTVGHHHAWGFAPFGFEEMGDPIDASMGFLFGMDADDPLLRVSQNPEEYAWYNRTLEAMTPLLAEAYGTNRLQAVISEREENSMRFGDFVITAMMNTPLITRKDGVCLALQTAENEFFLIANACAIMLGSANPEKPHVDLLELEDGAFVDGKWVMHRRLNGDEAQLMQYQKPTLLRVKAFAYA